MKYIFATIACFFLCSSVYGQGQVQGQVFDEDRHEIVAATVYLFMQKDSSIVQSVLTDSKGQYCFDHVPKGSFYVIAKRFGCSSQKKKIMIWNDSRLTVDVFLKDDIQLEPVEVVSSGITVNGDTTTYSVNRFTSGSERNLKEVLERLPNISVDEKFRSVTANGKHVNRILVEGQDLFQGNISVPLENLSSEGVQKVEIIDNYSEYNIYDGFKTTNETVLNVGTDDKVRNRIKGEVEGGGGLLGKYTIRNSSLYIGRKFMMTGILASNNVGNKLLTFQDIVQANGGIRNILTGENPMDGLSKLMDTYSAFTNTRKDMFKQENSLASLNFIANPSKSIKISVSGIYGYNHFNSHKENSYKYLSGVEYTEESREKGHQHNGLLNMKLAYMPNKDLNVIYSGALIMAAQNRYSDNNIMEQNNITFGLTPNTVSTKNNLLLVKRLGNNILNLSFDFSLSRYKEQSAFESTNTYFSPSLGLDDNYYYRYDNKENTYNVQMFYLHRFSDTYYLRFSLQYDRNEQYFITQNTQLNQNEFYDNDLKLDYTTYSEDAMLGKDRGNLTFFLRLRNVLYSASTNIQRNFERMNTDFLSPMLQMKYQFSPFHHIMMNYEYSKKKNSISNVIDRAWLKSYNQIISSNADRLFSPSHKFSLAHLLSLQYIGLNFANNITYEVVKDPITDNYSQEGFISKIEKTQGTTGRLLMLMSSAEYKFLNIPLNTRLSINYNLSYNPIYYNSALYDALSNNLLLMLQFVTFYKKGFNGSLKWQINNQTQKGTPMYFRLTATDLAGQLSWQNHRIFASVNAKLSTYNQNKVNTRNIYYGFEFRYKLRDNLSFELYGTDVVHLKERKQMNGNNTSFCSTNSLTWFMPGYIKAGLLYKY